MDLPPEILQLVYSKLDVGELLGLYVTSKQLAAAIPRSMWRRVYIDLFTRKEMWDRTCDHYGSRDHSASLKRVFEPLGLRVDENSLPKLCKHQAAKNILPYLEQLSVSITYDEPTPVKTRNDMIVFASSHPFFELLVKKLLPKYRPKLEEMRVQAVISERGPIPPVQTLMSYFPDAIKHVWLYAQGVGGLCSFDTKSLFNIRQLGICYESSPRDYSYSLVQDEIGPFLPESANLLVLCGDIGVQPLMGSHLQTLVVKTINIPHMRIPQSVRELTLNGDYDLTMRTLDVSRITSFEMTAMGNGFHLQFACLSRLTIAFWPRPGRWSTTTSIINHLMSSLEFNPPLTQFCCSGLAITSMIYFVQNCPAMQQLSRLTMNQPREHFREKFQMRRWNMVEMCRKCTSLESIILTNLNRDDILAVSDAQTQAHDLCPLLQSLVITTDWHVAQLTPIPWPVVDTWINIETSCRYAYKFPCSS